MVHYACGISGAGDRGVSFCTDAGNLRDGTEMMRYNQNETGSSHKTRFTPDNILDMDSMENGKEEAQISAAYRGKDDSGETDEPEMDDWEMDLEDAIQQQTMLEQPGLKEAYGASNRQRTAQNAENHAGNTGNRPGTGTPGGRRNRRQADNRNQEEEITRHRNDGLLYEEYEEDASYRAERNTNAGRTRCPAMSRREQREYEEFLAYKEAQKHSRSRKKKHRGRRLLLLLLILLIGVPLLYIAARMNGIMEGVSTSEIKDLISDEVQKSQETGSMAGYTNIALFGLDSTEQSLDAGNNRTDVMIIASINDKTGAVKLVSVYRDTYLDIGDGNYQKANAAYAYGGPEQAIKMLNTNLDLNITDYATIGFAGVADMIDSVGGIEIDVQQDEIDHLNNYQSTMATELGKEYVPLTETGLQTLNGLQATAYCRIRYTDGGDFKRTERQKEVLSKTFAKLKKSGPVAMLKAADSLASEVKTSLNAAEISALVLKALRMDIEDTSGFPNEQYRTVAYVGDQSCVIPIHLTDNVTWLHQYLFEDDSYQASQTVQTISSEISARSGY